MEKVSYAEAKEWFWVRTALWCVPAAIVSVIACFAYYGSIVEDFQPRLTYSAIAGVGGTLLGLIAASLSTQFPWMRLGRRLAWPFNSIMCAGISTVGALLICGVILSIMRDNIYDYPSEQVIATAYDLMLFAVALAAFWGLTLGTWFALRFDKYFVEPI